MVPVSCAEHCWQLRMPAVPIAPAVLPHVDWQLVPDMTSMCSAAHTTGERLGYGGWLAVLTGTRVQATGSSSRVHGCHGTWDCVSSLLDTARMEFD
jgi:hypothetical protein